MADVPIARRILEVRILCLPCSFSVVPLIFGGGPLSDFHLFKHLQTHIPLHPSQLFLEYWIMEFLRCIPISALSLEQKVLSPARRCSIGLQTSVDAPASTFYYAPESTGGLDIALLEQRGARAHIDHSHASTAAKQ